MPHLDESGAELSRALDELSMAGVAMNTTVLDHARVEPAYERADDQYRWEAPDTPRLPSVTARLM